MSIQKWWEKILSGLILLHLGEVKTAENTESVENREREGEGGGSVGKGLRGQNYCKSVVKLIEQG